MNSPTLGRLFLLVTLFVLCSAIAVGIYSQASKSQKQVELANETSSLSVTKAELVVSGRETYLAGVVAGPAATTIQGNERERVEAELITLRPTGFDRNEITRPAGPFLLATTNRTGLEEVVIRLDRVGGNRLQELRVSKKRRHWQGVVNLPPGQYILSEASHPDWICQISITAQ